MCCCNMLHQLSTIYGVTTLGLLHGFIMLMYQMSLLSEVSVRAFDELTHKITQFLTYMSLMCLNYRGVAGGGG